MFPATHPLRGGRGGEAVHGELDLPSGIFFGHDVGEGKGDRTVS